jgi:hypothetical protein
MWSGFAGEGLWIYALPASASPHIRSVIGFGQVRSQYVIFVTSGLQSNPSILLIPDPPNTNLGICPAKVLIVAHRIESQDRVSPAQRD